MFIYHINTVDKVLLSLTFLINSQIGKIMFWSMITFAGISTISSFVLLICIFNLPKTHYFTMYLYRKYIIFNNIVYSTIISTFISINLKQTANLTLPIYDLKQLIYEDSYFDVYYFNKGENKFKNNMILLNFFGVFMIAFYFASHCSLFFSLSDRVWAILSPTRHKKIGKKVTIGIIIFITLNSFIISVIPIVNKGYNMNYGTIRNVFVFVRGIKSLNFFLVTYLLPLILLTLMYTIYIFIFIKYHKNTPNTRSNPATSNNQEKQFFKVLVCMVMVYIFSTLPSIILVWLSNYIDINKNKSFFLIPTKNFYTLLDSLIVTSIFLTFFKINCDNFFFYIGDEKIKTTSKSLAKNFKIKCLKRFTNRKSNLFTNGVRDLTFNPQIPPMFLENNVTRPRIYNETEL